MSTSMSCTFSGHRKLSLDLNLNITKTQIISVRKLLQQRELELLSNNLDWSWKNEGARFQA
jgi:hypothetical protein